MTLRDSRHSRFRAVSTRTRTHTRTRTRDAILTNGASSLGNFGVTVLVARNSSVGEFGQFAVAWTVYMLLAGCIRSSVAETLIAQLRRDSWSDALRTTLVLASISGLGTILIGLAVSSPYLVLLGVALPGLCVFDLVKVLSLTLGRSSVAVAQDLLWTIVTLSAGLVLSRAGAPPFMIGVAWAASGAGIGLMMGICILRSKSASPRRPRLVTRDLVSGWYALDYVIGSGSMQLTLNALALAVTPTVVGTLRAGGTFLSPMTLVTAAVRPLLIGNSAAHKSNGIEAQFKSSVQTLRRIALLTSPVLLIANLVPDSIGSDLLGASWDGAHRVVLPLTIEAVFSLASSVAFAAHRAHQVSRRTVSVRAGLAIVRVIAVVAAGYYVGAVGAAWSMAGVAVLGSAVWWTSYRLILPTRRQDNAEAAHVCVCDD